MIKELLDWTSAPLDGRCTSPDMTWSILDSSPPNANLAAVLAGFMVTAIVFLLGREKDGSDRAVAHTVMLFFAGVLILGLNSYLFGSIASMRPRVQNIGVQIAIPQSHTATWQTVSGDDVYVCGLVWSQGMAASGMLAVGGTLLIAGLGWIITRFAHESKITSKLILVLGNVLTMFIIVATYAHLAFTTYLYIGMMDTNAIHTRVKDWMAPLVVGLGFGLPLVCSLLIVSKTVRLWKVQPGDELHKDCFPAVFTASILTALLAVLSPIYARGIAEADYSTPFQMYCAIGLCMGVPAIIFFLIALSSPGPKQPPAAEEDNDGQGQRPYPLALTAPLILALTLFRKLSAKSL